MNPESVVVRPMTLPDIDSVMAMASGVKHAPHWAADAYRAAIDPENRPRRVCLVAQISGGIAGFVVASLIEPQAELESIVVAPSAQRRGVARALFGVLRAELAKASVTEVILEVRTSNAPARALYRSLGFSACGHRPGYYADPVEDAILMNLQF